jgi:hypothetical protein
VKENETFPKLPEEFTDAPAWKFKAREVSMSVYEVVGTEASGGVVSARVFHFPEIALDACHRMAINYDERLRALQEAKKQ